MLPPPNAAQQVRSAGTACITIIRKDMRLVATHRLDSGPHARSAPHFGLPCGGISGGEGEGAHWEAGMALVIQ
jgi:hypothetical protein